MNVHKECRHGVLPLDYCADCDSNEDLKYQLESLSSYEPSDIDNPEFEVGYEDINGDDGFATVCCVDVAKRALDRIKWLERESLEMRNGLKVSNSTNLLLKKRLDKLTQK